MEQVEPYDTHRWAGWPGAFCLDCGIEDPVEIAIAYNMTDEPIDCPVCPVYKQMNNRLASLEELAKQGQEMGFYDKISKCSSCHCVTHTLDGTCGKCKAKKEKP